MARASGDEEAEAAWDHIAGKLKDVSTREAALERLYSHRAKREPLTALTDKPGEHYRLADLLAASDTPRGRKQVREAWNEHEAAKRHEAAELARLDLASD